MNTGRIGAENPLLQEARGGAQTNPELSVRPGAGGADVDYSTFQLDALRRAVDRPHVVPSSAVDHDVPPPSTDADGRLRWAAEQLEALFVHELLKSMRRTVMKSGMFDGMGVKMFEEMLDEERSKEMAAAGGIGLAQLLYDQLTPHVSVQRESRTTRSAEETNAGGAT